MNNNTKYQLEAFSAIGSLLHSLPEDQFHALLKARKVILFGLLCEQRLDLLLENYAELEKYLLNLALQNSIFRGPASSIRLREGRHSINRYLSNLLSSARLYLDQTDHALKEQFGESSSCYERYHNERKREYDDSAAFKSFEALRNHVQHCGLPAHSIKFFSVVDEAKANDNKAGDKFVPPHTRNRHVVTFSVIPENLKENKRFNKRGLDALRSLANDKGKVDLMPLIREYVNSIASIHQSVRMSTSSALEDADQLVNRLFTAIYSCYGQISTSGKIWALTNESVSNAVPIDLEWIEERRAFVEKNAYSSNLKYHYASSQ